MELRLLFSHQLVSDSLWPHGLQHAKLFCPPLSLRVCSNSCPLHWWCHLTISSSATPFPPALSLSQHQGLFQWVSSLHQVAKVLEFQLQHQSFQRIFKAEFILDWLVCSPCSPKESWVFSRTTVLRHQFFKVGQSLIKCIVCYCCILWIWWWNPVSLNSMKHVIKVWHKPKT